MGPSVSRGYRRLIAAAAMSLAAGIAPAAGQPGRPSATIAATPAAVVAGAGSTATVVLHVTLPEGVHVQAHEPDDPLLIPTVATVTPPSGVAVRAVTYPAPSPLVQTGRAEPLQVLGPVFDVEVTLDVAAAAAAGEVEVPVVLRYQACNDTTCFPPARAAAAWRVNVRR